MGTIMVYNSSASTFIKPNTIELNIKISAFKETAKEVVQKINEDRQIAKDLICDKKSYQKDSYHQNSLDLRRRIVREYFYENLDGKRITEKEYEALDFTHKSEYNKKYTEKFLGYDAFLTISAVLDYGETAVQDLVDIFNMATEKKFTCTYEHSVSQKSLEDTMHKLYIDCINKGVENMQKILDGLTVTSSYSGQRTANLLSIVDPEARSGMTDYAIGNSFEKAPKMMKSCRMDESFGAASAYTPEQIIMPELIEELFNNNIELTKSLDLKFEF